ncbi:MAG: helix-turn-helix domain-containing protein, partial [Chloroflexi bacterium]|nr:helix-turn-helix domain-containing protein [Chloroflexota bacterium]
MQSVLGGLIKSYRLRQGLSQSELLAAIGWHAHPSRLSRYEQGRVVPDRNTLEKLSSALGLRSDDRGRLLMEAGYVPTDEEVSAALQQLQPFMDAWKGPAYLTDFSWRFLGWNGPAAKIFGFPPDELERLPREKPRLLEFAFDSRWAVGRHIPEEILVPFGRGQIARFKAQQRDRTRQRWYRQLLKRLMPIPLFRELWRTTPGELGSELMDYNRVQMDSPVGR